MSAATRKNGYLEPPWARVVTPNTRGALAIIALLPRRTARRDQCTDRALGIAFRTPPSDHGCVLRFSSAAKITRSAARISRPSGKVARMALTVAIVAVTALTISFSASGHASAAATPGPWGWPTDPPRSIARPYLAPATPYTAGHRGIDIRLAPPESTPASVYAPADGVVYFVGYVVDRPVLTLQHDGGLLSSYEPVTSPLAAGDRIRRGQTIGTLESGHCVKACLHFGVRRGGEYVSPLNYLGGILHSVLLPTRPLSAETKGVRFGE